MGTLQPYVFTITPVWHDGNSNAWMFLEFTLYENQTYDFSEPTDRGDDIAFSVNISGPETGKVINTMAESPKMGAGFPAGIVSLVYDGQTKNSVKVTVY